MANVITQGLFSLEKGKLIDTQTGFVDAFNWLYKSVSNLRGGENCEVNWQLDDVPVIDVHIDNSNPYTDGEGGSGEEGQVSITGTDGSSATGSSFTFASESDSNVTVKVATGGTITVGVYYV